MNQTTRAVLRGLLQRREEERVDDLWTVKRFAKWKYETDEPTKAQINTVIRMCRNGVIPAGKVGKEWRIDTAEIMRGVRDGNQKDDAA